MEQVLLSAPPPHFMIGGRESLSNTSRVMQILVAEASLTHSSDILLLQQRLREVKRLAPGHWARDKILSFPPGWGLCAWVHTLRASSLPSLPDFKIFKDCCLLGSVAVITQRQLNPHVRASGCVSLSMSLSGACRQLSCMTEWKETSLEVK